MRYLAIDPGGKRTGVAVGDDVTRIATPAGAIVTTNADERLRQLERMIREHEPHELVLGLPLNADGSEGPSAKHAREFAAQLQERFKLPVRLVDERLSSYAADQKMNQSGLSHGQKKSRRDALAAMMILQGFFEDHGREKEHGR